MTGDYSRIVRTQCEDPSIRRRQSPYSSAGLCTTHGISPPARGLRPRERSSPFIGDAGGVPVVVGDLLRFSQRRPGLPPGRPRDVLGSRVSGAICPSERRPSAYRHSRESCRHACSLSSVCDDRATHWILGRSAGAEQRIRLFFQRLFRARMRTRTARAMQLATLLSPRRLPTASVSWSRARVATRLPAAPSTPVLTRT